MMFGTIKRKPLKILDFDIENRPLHYWYDDKTTAEITAIAWAFYGDESVKVRLLEPPPNGARSARRMLQAFTDAYDEADMVTGHFIRVHDLPIINAALMEYGMRTLSPKLTSDTKLDLVKRSSLSASQKNLAHLLKLERPKVDMPQANWRDANRLTDDGIELTKARVVGDILQHMQLRHALLEQGWLGDPKIWVPGGRTVDVTYVP